MKVPEVGTHVVYHRAEGSGDKRKHVAHDALVTGYERPPDHDPEEDGLPMLNVMFMEPSGHAQLGGINWSDALERAFSVPHQDVDGEGHHFYTVPGGGLPSAADLDEDADEKAAKDATAGKPVLLNGKKAKAVAVGK
jgi:hypothetical protein